MDQSIPRPFIDIILAMHDLIDRCKDDEEFQEIGDDLREFVNKLARYFYDKTKSDAFLNEEISIGSDQ